MPASPTRRRFLGSTGIALATLLAGCSGPDVTTESRSTTDTTENETISPSILSDPAAKERALAAEEEYLEGQLAGATCLDDWGTTATVIEKEATVIDRTEDGVRVEVIHPYWYTKTVSGQGTSIQEHADAGTRATYLVTTEDADRVNGDVVTPC